MGARQVVEVRRTDPQTDTSYRYVFIIVRNIDISVARCCTGCGIEMGDCYNRFFRNRSGGG
jgi:hypothetical protein